MPRGRVRTLDDAKQREICAILSSGCSLQTAASYVDCAPNTIRREAARNPAFGQQFRAARLRAQLSPLQAMREAASSHWRAAAWMLERADPDHFGRRPAPAFRSKQAQTLKDDILAVLNAEIDNPFVLRRVHKQIQQLMEYSIDGVVNVERNSRQLRTVLRQIEELERETETRGEAAYDAVFREAPPASATARTSPAATKSNAAPSSAAPSPTPKPHAPSGPGGPGAAKSASSTPKTGPTNPPRPSPPQQLDADLANTPVTWGDMTKVFQRLNKGAANGNGNRTSAADSAAVGPPKAGTDSPPPATPAHLIEVRNSAPDP